MRVGIATSPMMVGDAHPTRLRALVAARASVGGDSRRRSNPIRYPSASGDAFYKSWLWRHLHQSHFNRLNGYVKINSSRISESAGLVKGPKKNGKMLRG